MKKDIFKLLKNSSICKSLADEQINHLIQNNLITFAKYNRNEILFWTDEKPKNLVILLSGNITMGKNTFDGRRVLGVSNTNIGELIGEVRLFSDKKLFWDYAVALKHTEVLEISCEFLLNPVEKHADIQFILMQNIMRVFVRKFEFLSDKVRILSFPATRDRIAFYFLRMQNKQEQVVLNETREELADYLGIARPSLSRELGRLQDEGFIRMEGNEVIILNPVLFENVLE
ncbi:Crp/Fnr family transcriptional regulator [Listeria welshimeri]|uniref:Crp/Fnr family transcriptional regulator n=1 Tax=Listeria welshimeri TaxID=1643 RepID=A0A7X0T6F1_LISWE|nr:Crp/Fnr family transcriptional regulator [Listeria welshimeri]EAC8476552.1 Crp/Fnr family transcriptional regulator [Listeria monocytogenes]MBC1323447.1 Crp/Fnr family transcriptional regulator [Listeria welshimeri]MBC2007814.1 Crp/Fnr family transcriptional regulator [Listeria welshimeri]MBC2028048.1 Crp/Fnr family transcriptional regulator [Listeria welshimeri]MBC2215985.1 Crp/Fnr family transcriptional regulator [Listeria welshimeri]